MSQPIQMSEVKIWSLSSDILSSEIKSFLIKIFCIDGCFVTFTLAREIYWFAQVVYCSIRRPLRHQQFRFSSFPSLPLSSRIKETSRPLNETLIMYAPVSTEWEMKERYYVNVVFMTSYLHIIKQWFPQTSRFRNKTHFNGTVELLGFQSRTGSFQGYIRTFLAWELTRMKLIMIIRLLRCILCLRALWQ